MFLNSRAEAKSSEKEWKEFRDRSDRETKEFNQRWAEECKEFNQRWAQESREFHGRLIAIEERRNKILFKE